MKKNGIGKTSSAYGERAGVYRDLVGKHEGRNHLENRDVDGRIILENIFKRWDWGGGPLTGFIWLIGVSSGLL